MTAICASHYRNPLNDYVGKKHHHKNRFRQRQSSRSAFYQPGLRVIESRNEKDDHGSRKETTNSTTSMGQQPESSSTTTTTTANALSTNQTEGHWGFRPSALQFEDYGRGDMSVSEIVDCYVKDNERAEQEGVAIPPKPALQRGDFNSGFRVDDYRNVRDALFSASSSSSTSSSASASTSNTSRSFLRCLQWNIQAFLSPKDERNMHTITAGIIRSICETDSDVLVLNEIHWREMDKNIHIHHDSNTISTTNSNIDNRSSSEAISIRSSQYLLEEVLRLRGYHYSRVAKHGDTPTMVATRKKVLQTKEIILSDNRSALCLLIETETTLPNGSCCWVVGTHLDAFDAKRRRSEISRLLQDTNTNIGSNNNSSSSSNNTTISIPVLIAGDFNQQRSRDYTSAEWNKVVGSADLRGVPLDDGVANILETSGFRCILDDVVGNKHGKNSNSETTTFVACNWNQNQPPPSTHWSGTTIDYTYYSNQHSPMEDNSHASAATTAAATATTTTTTTNIAPHGVYVGPAGFSDHRMTVTDWTLTTQTNSNDNANNTTAPTTHIDKTFFFHHLPAGRHHSWLYSYRNRHSHYNHQNNCSRSNSNSRRHYHQAIASHK